MVERTKWIAQAWRQLTADQKQVSSLDFLDKNYWQELLAYNIKIFYKMPENYIFGLLFLSQKKEDGLPVFSDN